jgi:hypothetical protein
MLNVFAKKTALASCKKFKLFVDFISQSGKKNAYSNYELYKQEFQRVTALHN